MTEQRHVILIDGSANRDVLAARLRMQGYAVTATADPAEGAFLALSQPPAAIVADLWMPGISGVQLCRLLRAEPATETTPVILRGPELDQRSRFWADRAGATAYVAKGRMGDLVRALAKSEKSEPDQLGFFVQLSDSSTEIRDRIAAHLDAALFESVIASEVRGLSVCGEFDRLFDLLSQLVSQVTRYRWLAVSTTQPMRCAIHAHPASSPAAANEARAALGLRADVPLTCVEDEDAYADGPPADPIVRPIYFGEVLIGKVALAPKDPHDAKDAPFVDVLARELAGPVRIAALVEESQRLARTDPLTSLLNRRAFIDNLETELARAERSRHPLSVVLLDVDHFKQINDRRGHAAGDAVLAALGRELKALARTADIVARWGGEEFVLALVDTDLEGGRLAAERFRAAIEALEVVDAGGARIPLTASLGVSAYQPGDGVDTLVDRADAAMYRAKSSGRNRVALQEVEPLKNLRVAS